MKCKCHWIHGRVNIDTAKTKPNHSSGWPNRKIYYACAMSERTKVSVHNGAKHTHTYSRTTRTQIVQYPTKRLAERRSTSIWKNKQNANLLPIKFKKKKMLPTRKLNYGRILIHVYLFRCRQSVRMFLMFLMFLLQQIISSFYLKF